MTFFLFKSVKHMDTLFIHSSEVAACIGEHRYKKRWEAFQSIFERYKYGQEYKKAIERNRKLGVTIISKEERFKNVLTSNDQLKQEAQSLLSKEIKTSEDLKHTIEEFEEHLVTKEQDFKQKKQSLKTHVLEKAQQKSDLDAQITRLKKQEQLIDQEILINESQSKDCESLITNLKSVQSQLQSIIQSKDQVSTELNQVSIELSNTEHAWNDFKETKKELISQKQTQFGKQKEDTLISSHALGAISENNSKYYKKLISSQPFEWGIGGKIDGLRDGELIEIKNRKSHIYDPLPVYDVIQLQCYIQILDLSKATLIQSLATENNTFVTKETVLQRDNTYWNETIIPKLTEFVHAFYVFVNDPLQQDRFLQTSDNRKSVLLNSFIKSATKQMIVSTKPAESKKTLHKRLTKKDMEFDVSPSKKQKTTSTSSHLITSAINVLDVCKNGLPSVETEIGDVSKDPIDAMDALMDSTIAIKNINPITTTKEINMPVTSNTSDQSSDVTNPSDVTKPSDNSKPAPIVACFFETPELQMAAVDCSVPLYKLVPDTWVSVLNSQFNLEYFKQLTAFVDQDYKTFLVHPPRSKIFTALEKCPFDKTKVVILGQDPYIHTGEAMGMSFSVPKGVKFPRSLKNIYEELKADVNITPTTGDLTSWADQGVLLLNTVLTVRDSKSDSHAGKGWEQFTNHIIRQISERLPHVVFLLWGGKAQSKKPLINTSKHTILETSHPSPLSYTRGFQGCKHFSKTNEALKQHGQTPIDWNVSL